MSAPDVASLLHRPGPRHVRDVWLDDHVEDPHLGFHRVRVELHVVQYSTVQYSTLCSTVPGTCRGRCPPAAPSRCAASTSAAPRRATLQRETRSIVCVEYG